MFISQLENKVSCCIKEFFNIQEYHSYRNVIVEIEGKPDTLMSDIVMGTETKLVCFEQACFFSVPPDTLILSQILCLLWTRR